ncbi:MAG TPA: hypothetical protein PLR38_02410 [Syntrophorhabdaceae bacterium]|nr:hypothetical protein [Syntrophorhabdaceae bacterium]HOL04585.1 hypothetical protein [Syntrophorhabdaceae bacterium]HPP41359.1 hypothetical protein [Syntrophorhabdaceae bacterium]
MKRYLVVFLALLLVLPAVSYAGSVTSKYDVTIGGYVKFDVVYTDQNNTHNYRAASRDNRSAFAANMNDSNDAVTWAGGETRLNLSIKGPDAWGAKTSAFIEGDFRGGSGGGQGAATYGLFGMRHAFMNMDWANTKLLIGHTWQAWGLLPTLNVLGASENHFMRGNVRVPQIRLTQNFTKDLNMVIGLAAPTNTFGNTQPDEKSRALLPDTSIEFQYKSTALGKIGSRSLSFGLGGMVGKEKVTYQWPANHYKSTQIKRWGSSFYGYIPIIPEKANNKTGALALTGNVFMGQGLGLYLPAAPGNPYDRPNDTVMGATPVSPGGDPTVDAKYPMTSGGWAQMTFYFTDKMSSNLLFGWQRNSFSQQASFQYANAVRYIQNWIFNVLYDVSPAIKFGAEYTRVMTSYTTGAAGTRSYWTATGKPSGTLNAVRLGAYYYF